MTREDVLAAETRLAQAMRQSDLEALDALLAEELRFSTPDGQIIGKADDLAVHRAGVQRLTRLELAEPTIALFPTFAVVLVQATLEGRFGEQPIQGRFAYTRVWTATHRGLQVVAGQVAPLRDLS